MGGDKSLIFAGTATLPARSKSPALFVGVPVVAHVVPSRDRHHAPIRRRPGAAARIAELAAGAADILDRSDIILAVTDETRAMGVTRMLEAMVPDATILFCPGSDASRATTPPPRLPMWGSACRRCIGRKRRWR